MSPNTDPKIGMTAAASARGAANGSPVDELLQLDGVAIELLTRGGWAPVLEDVTFSVRSGETVGLVGESGSGKSVTGLAIMGLLARRQSRFAAGTIKFDGIDLPSLSERRMRELRGNRMAMVFQEPMTSLNPAFTVGDQIGESLRVHKGMSRRAAQRRAIEVLDLVGVAGAARRITSYPHEFSGGMRQRVMIAMAVACEPDLLICDEPTTALDVTVQAQVLELISDLQQRMKMGVLLITHDLGVVAEVCDRVVTMYSGEVVERGDVHTMFAHRAHPYTDGLLRSITAGADSEGMLSYIPGRPPALTQRPPGCRFHPRCQYAVERCTVEHPALRQVGTQQTRCHLAEQVLDLDVAVLPGGSA